MDSIGGSAVNQANHAQIQQSSSEKIGYTGSRSVKPANLQNKSFQSRLHTAMFSALTIKNRKVKLASNTSVQQQNVRTTSAKEESSAPKKAKNTKTASFDNKNKAVTDILTKAGKLILNDLKDLNASKKAMQKLPFNATSRREASIDINIKKREITANVKRFNEKAQASGNAHIMLDMRTIETGLVDQGNQFLENNQDLAPFFQK